MGILISLSTRTPELMVTEMLAVPINSSRNENGDLMIPIKRGKTAPIYGIMAVFSIAQSMIVMIFHSYFRYG